LAKNQKSLSKKIALLLLLCVLVTALALGGMYAGMRSRGNSLLEQYAPQALPAAAQPGANPSGADRIHFLNTGPGDCFLIESQGLFALVDAAEDNDNPRALPGLEFTGYEDLVIDYLKQVAGDENGKVTLEWVLGTHTHSDHIGGFDSLILDQDITVKKAYLKTYDNRYISDYEIKNWDNDEVWHQMADACAARGVPLISELPEEPWDFGNFTVQFFNTGYQTAKKTGENENAVGTLLTIRDKKIFLAADINNITKTEKTIAPAIGKVDLLKVGHHGHILSSSSVFIRTLDPDFCVVPTAATKKIFPPVYWRLTMGAGAPIFVTGECNGLIADFTGGDILFYQEIHS